MTSATAELLRPSDLNHVDRVRMRIYRQETCSFAGFVTHFEPTEPS